VGHGVHVDVRVDVGLPDRAHEATGHQLQPLGERVRHGRPYGDAAGGQAEAGPRDRALDRQPHHAEGEAHQRFEGRVAPVVDLARDPAGGLGLQLQDGLGEILLGREVEVERALGDMGVLDDVTEAGRFVAVPVEQIGCGPDDRRAGLLRT
jgi:hypothetical protein